MKKLMIAVVCAALGATSSGLLAQSGSIRFVPPPPQGVKFAQPWRPAGSGGDTRIVGTVIDIRQVPVAYVKVQLRSLITGTVQQEGESNANGEYEFAVSDSGTYVVEMLLVDGYVIALSNAGSLARFETLRTLVQLPGRWDSQLRNMIMPQNNSAFLGMSARTTMTAATLLLAVDANLGPIDPGEAVSATTLR